MTSLHADGAFEAPGIAPGPTPVAARARGFGPREAIVDASPATSPPSSRTSSSATSHPSSIPRRDSRRVERILLAGRAQANVLEGLLRSPVIDEPARRRILAIRHWVVPEASGER